MAKEPSANNNVEAPRERSSAASPARAVVKRARPSSLGAPAHRNGPARSKPTVVVVLAVVAGTLSACGGSGGETVDFYSSLPLTGASSARASAIVDGAKLALAQAGGRAGQFIVRYVSFDDSTARAETWDPRRTAANPAFRR